MQTARQPRAQPCSCILPAAHSSAQPPTSSSAIPWEALRGTVGAWAQYLLMPKTLTPWNWGSLGRRTLSREAVLIMKCTGSYLV